jgi:hypothetical protein
LHSFVIAVVSRLTIERSVIQNEAVNLNQVAPKGKYESNPLGNAGNREVKARTLADGAFHPDASAVGLDDMPRDGQP